MEIGLWFLLGTTGHRSFRRFTPTVGTTSGGAGKWGDGGSL